MLINISILFLLLLLCLLRELSMIIYHSEKQKLTKKIFCPTFRKISGIFSIFFRNSLNMDSVDIRYIALNERSSDDIKWNNPLVKLKNSIVYENPMAMVNNPDIPVINSTEVFNNSASCSAALEKQQDSRQSNRTTSLNAQSTMDDSIKYYQQPNGQKKLLRALFICILLLLVINFIFSLCFINSYFDEKTLKKSLEKYTNMSKYCMSDKCVLATGNIYKSLSQDADPCDNFYQYACGGWMQKTLLPNGFPRWSETFLKIF